MKIASFSFLVAFTSAASAATSQYSDLDLSRCKRLNKDVQEDDGGVWLCPGIKGYEVTYSEGDLRGAVAFGPNPDAQCSSTQSFGAFNSPGKKIEWRMDKGKPIATILRWTTDNGEDNTKKNWLVVTKLDGQNTCRTALIDTQLSEPNKLARERADSTQNFNCEKDLPEIVSRLELKADELMSGVPCGKEPFRQ